MRELRTNTAVIITVGPFYDKTDGVTIETALTITNERITLTADTDDGIAPTVILANIPGAASGTANDLDYVNLTGSPSTNNSAGLMRFELSAANVNRLGRMFLSITDAANHVPVFHELEVVSAAYYDWKYGSTTPPVNVTQLLGTAWLAPGTAGTPDVNAKLVSASATAADNLETAALAYSATRGLAGTALPAAAADAAGGLPISDAGGLDLDTKLANTNEITVARMGALTDWINGGRLDLILDIIAADTTTDIPALLATIDTVVDAIQAKTDNLPTDPADQSLIISATNTILADTNAILVDTAEIGAAGAGLGAVPWNAAWDAEVQSEVADALAVYDPPTAAELVSEIDAVQTDVAAVKADTAAILVDTGTTLDARIPAALTGTCAALGSTTTIIASALSPTSAVNNQFNGRIVTFDKDTTTAALRGQSTDITGYVHATLTLTVTALTTAAVSGDTFTIT